jgi:thiol:disulfide interchange protein
LINSFSHLRKEPSMSLHTSALVFNLALLTGAVSAAVPTAAAEAAKEPAPEAAPAPTPPWTNDFAAAKAQAKKEGKDLLLFFTGSDWCAFCNVQKKEGFTTEAFTTEATKKFVLVEVDLPEKAKLPEATEKQNKALVIPERAFGVKGPPASFLGVQSAPELLGLFLSLVRNYAGFRGVFPS